MALHRRYLLFLCPSCGDKFQYMGWCDACGTRLLVEPVIPVAALKEFQTAHDDDDADGFVLALLSFCGR